MVEALCESGADFVIIDGLAVTLHGGDHVTVDLDCAYARVRENAKKIASAFAPYNPRPSGWSSDLPFVWDEQTILNSTVLTLDTDIGRVDFLGQPEGARPYKELQSNAHEVDLGGVKVLVASIDDLISMKRAAGRPKDMGHIAELETIKRLMAESD